MSKAILRLPVFVVGHDAVRYCAGSVDCVGPHPARLAHATFDPLYGDEGLRVINYHRNKGGYLPGYLFWVGPDDLGPLLELQTGPDQEVLQLGVFDELERRMVRANVVVKRQRKEPKK